MKLPKFLESDKAKAIFAGIVLVIALVLGVYQITKMVGGDDGGMDWSVVWFICDNGHEYSLADEEVREEIIAVGGVSGQLVLPCIECGGSARQALKCPDCDKVFLGFECPECGWSKQKELRKKWGYKPPEGEGK